MKFSRRITRLAEKYSQQQMRKEARKKNHRRVEAMKFSRRITRLAEKYSQQQMRKEARKKRECEGILVHGAMKYRCRDCGYEWWMFLEKGLEDPAYINTERHKPVPFATTCGMCKGIAYDVSGYVPIPEPEQYIPLPYGESYFANYSRRDCGTAILASKDRGEGSYMSDASCRTCGKCKHHRYDKESDGSSVCENDKSEHFVEYTEDTDTCDKWEGRRCR